MNRAFCLLAAVQALWLGAPIAQTPGDTSTQRPRFHVSVEMVNLSITVFDEKHRLVTDLAEESGGSAFDPERIEDLAEVYDRIANELKSQYELSYISTNNEADGTWRRIQVLCNRVGMNMRTRTGYYAPPTARLHRRKK